MKGSERLSKGKVALLDQAGHAFFIRTSRLRSVRDKDGAALAAGKLEFNLHTIIGGQLANDVGPGMFYIYPEGNCIEASADSPYFVIGRKVDGKPILDRSLSRDMSMRSTDCLAFDATRMRVNDEDYPFDVLTLEKASPHVKPYRFDAKHLHDTQEWWQQRLHSALHDMPIEWADVLSENKPQ